MGLLPSRRLRTRWFLKVSLDCGTDFLGERSSDSSWLKVGGGEEKEWLCELVTSHKAPVKELHSFAWSKMVAFPYKSIYLEHWWQSSDVSSLPYFQIWSPCWETWKLTGLPAWLTAQAGSNMFEAHLIPQLFSHIPYLRIHGKLFSVDLGTCLWLLFCVLESGTQGWNLGEG